MDQLSSGNHVFARIASPFINGIKRVMTEIGIFTDTKAYKGEITRYEGEIQHNSHYENEPQLKIEAEEREAVAS